MPLQHSASKQAFDTNVHTLMHDIGKSPHVKSREQALAIAYSTQRRAAHGKAEGGVAGFAFGGMSQTPWFVRNEARGMTHTGPISSIVPGRTDHHAMKVASGSYVLPADHVSSLGQGNTQAGMAILNHMFSSGPYGMGKAAQIRHGAGAPKPPHLARVSTGGARGEQSGQPVDVLTAGGEYVIPPHIVTAIGGGDIKRGHNILDHWVVSNRKKHVKTLKTLPGPAKS